MKIPFEQQDKKEMLFCEKERKKRRERELCRSLSSVIPRARGPFQKEVTAFLSGWFYVFFLLYNLTRKTQLL